MGILSGIKELVRGAIGTYVIAERLDGISAALASQHAAAVESRLARLEDAIAKQAEPPPAPVVPMATAQPAPPEHAGLRDYVRDDFLNWLSFINPGMLSQPNLRLIDYAIRNMPDRGCIIEIGSFAGLSLNHIIHMLRMAGRPHRAFSVDEWNFEGAGEIITGSSVSFADYRRHVMETFRRNVTLFSGDRLPGHIEVSSDTFFRLWAEGATATDFFGRPAQLGGPIAFAYIDGSHTYEQSKRDFENVDRFLAPGGIVIFDDSADGSGWGSHQTAAEAAARLDYEVIDRSLNYCIAKRPD